MCFYNFKDFVNANFVMLLTSVIAVILIICLIGNIHLIKNLMNNWIDFGFASFWQNGRQSNSNRALYFVSQNGEMFWFPKIFIPAGTTRLFFCNERYIKLFGELGNGKRVIFFFKLVIGVMAAQITALFLNSFNDGVDIFVNDHDRDSKSLKVWSNYTVGKPFCKALYFRRKSKKQ